MANALPVVLRADIDAATTAQLQGFVSQKWVEMVLYAQQKLVIAQITTLGQSTTIASQRAADMGQYLS